MATPKSARTAHSAAKHPQARRGRAHTPPTAGIASRRNPGCDRGRDCGVPRRTAHPPHAAGWLKRRTGRRRNRGRLPAGVTGHDGRCRGPAPGSERLGHRPGGDHPTGRWGVRGAPGVSAVPRRIATRSWYRPQPRGRRAGLLRRECGCGPGADPGRSGCGRGSACRCRRHARRTNRPGRGGRFDLPARHLLAVEHRGLRELDGHTTQGHSDHAASYRCLAAIFSRRRAVAMARASVVRRSRSACPVPAGKPALTNRCSVVSSM
jgi:hypothetical protein